jgi:hypothetical protein
VFALGDLNCVPVLDSTYLSTVLYTNDDCNDTAFSDALTVLLSAVNTPLRGVTVPIGVLLTDPPPIANAVPETLLVPQLTAPSRTNPLILDA